MEAGQIVNSQKRSNTRIGWKLEGDIKRDIISMERKINRDSINSWQEGGLMSHPKFVSINIRFLFYYPISLSITHILIYQKQYF